MSGTVANFYKNVLDDVVTKHVESLDNGQFDESFINELKESFDDSYFEEFEKELVSRIERDVDIRIRQMQADAVGDLPSVRAHVSFQIWRNDYAEEVGEKVFDCTRALNAMSLPYLNDILRSGRYADVDWDDLLFESASLGLVEDWDGPFTITIIDEEEFEEYMRVRNLIGR